MYAIRSYYEIQAETHLVEFVVSSGKSPIVGASVSFNGKVLVTDETGLVQFSDVLTGSKMPYVVIKDGYGEFDDYIDVEADVNHQVELDITNIEEGESVQFKVFPNPVITSYSIHYTKLYDRLFDDFFTDSSPFLVDSHALIFSGKSCS